MPPPRKKLEADILEDWLRMQREQRQAPKPLKGRMPRVTPMASSRQRRALRQTGDEIRAVYGQEHQMNATPVRPNEEGLTRSPEPDPDYRTGKATDTRNPEPKKSRRRKQTSRVRTTNPDTETSTLDLQAWIKERGG